MSRASRPHRASRWAVALLLLAGMAPLACGQSAPTASPLDPAATDLPGGLRPTDLAGPGPVEVDLFHPDRRAAEPALGGRVILHLSPEPPNLCYPIENSASTTMVLRDLHASLLRLDWEIWQLELLLAESVDKEDQLVLDGPQGEVLFGQVVQEGDEWVVRSGSPANPAPERRVPAARVAAVERQTVFTFHLRDGVTWHDGHPFDAADVLFSWELYSNPHVDCDEKRYRYQEITRAEVLDRLTIRFFYRRQYFQALSTFDEGFCILPRHLYDLADPDCRDHDPQATPEARGRYINQNPHNIDWVGLGPYRLREWVRNQWLDAVRYEGYFEREPRRRGYVDEIRWRIIGGDDQAFQALLNGEMDIFYRLKTEDYYGAATEQPLFRDAFYKCFTYTGYPSFLSWNTLQPELSDPRVRLALAHAFDEDGWIATKYLGLGVRITGTQHFLGPGYDRSIPPVPHDPQRAVELLEEAGWYDRDGDGTVDRDGRPFEISFLMPAGNKASEATGQRLQAAFAEVGVRLAIEPLDWATFMERRRNREFDSANIAWVSGEFEADPFQIWHGSQAAPDLRSSNDSGFSDPQVDRLIEAGRRELDPEKRHALWREMQRLIHDAQPYLFMHNVPTKLAINRKLHGVRLYKLHPGIRLRDLYYEAGTPGTRPLDQP